MPNISLPANNEIPKWTKLQSGVPASYRQAAAAPAAAAVTSDASSMPRSVSPPTVFAPVDQSWLYKAKRATHEDNLPSHYVIEDVQQNPPQQRTTTQHTPQQRTTQSQRSRK